MWNEWSTLKKLIFLKAAGVIGSSPSWVWQLLTGTAPLTLLDAVAHPIHSLTQYGLCVQDGTPTPDAPVDIMCNNGALKVSLNLANMVSDNIVVGKYINNSGVESSDTANFYYAPYVPVTPGGTYTMATSRSIWYFSVMQYDSSQNFLRRTIWGATNTPVGTEKTFSVGADCTYIRFGSNMRKATISLADVLAVDWMLTQTETAQEFRPYGEIYIDGTPETLTVRGTNLLDPTTSNIVIGEYVSADGSSAVGANNWRTDYIPIVGGKTYAFWGREKADNTISAYNRINWYTADKTHITPRPSITKDTPTVGTAPSNAAFVRLSSAPYNSSAAITRDTFDEYNWMFAEAAQEIPYEPYVQPQTVTVPMLLSVDTVKDEWEAVLGPLTHRIGIYVIKGSDDEGWAENTSYSGTFYADCLPSATLITSISLFTRYEGVLGSRSVASMNNGTAKCGSTSNRQRIFIRDTSCADVDALKAKLSGFYAAGEPCIVAFALANKTTEQTTPHALHTVSGTNVVDVSAAVEGVGLSVEYAKEAS